MLTVAVYHTDERRQQTAANQILSAMKKLHVAGKVCTVQNVDVFRRDVEQGRFDILCLSTGVPQAENWLQQDRTEIILLDTPVQRLGDYLRYKPAAWLPDSRADAAPALQACFSYLQRRREACLCVQTKTRCVRIPYRQILYLESQRRQVVVHTRRPEDLVAFTATLDAVEQALGPKGFLRCHQSYLVNLEQVEEIDKTQRLLKLRGGQVVDISKRYYKPINEAFFREGGDEDVQKCLFPVQNGTKDSAFSGVSL